jgi:hypothetical protein
MECLGTPMAGRPSEPAGAGLGAGRSIQALEGNHNDINVLTMVRAHLPCLLPSFMAARSGAAHPHRHPPPADPAGAPAPGNVGPHHPARPQLRRKFFGCTSPTEKSLLFAETATTQAIPECPALSLVNFLATWARTSRACTSRKIGHEWADRRTTWTIWRKW